MMIVALQFLLLAPSFLDAPQILVTHMAFGFCVCAPPNLRGFARRDGSFHAALIERVIASPLIIGAVGADLFDLTGHVLKQIRQGFGVADVVRAGHDADDFESRFISFDAGRIHHQAPRLGPILDRQGDCQLPGSAVRASNDRALSDRTSSIQDRLEEALHLTAGRTINGLDCRHGLNHQVGIS